MIVLVDYNDWHHIAFWMGKAMVNSNSLWQIMYSSCIYQARSATGYFECSVPSLPGMGHGRITRHTYRLAGIAYLNLA